MRLNLVNFADDGTIFLRGITSLNRIQRILKIYEETFSSKINFSKSETLYAGTYKNRTGKLVQMAWSRLSINILDISFGNSALENSN